MTAGHRGGGTYDDGETCTLTATGNESYSFTNWTKGGVEVSTEATYNFTVTEDAAFVANFEENNITQTTTFNLGWTWWSSCIEQSDLSGLAMLEDELGTNGLTIKSQGSFATYNGTKWTGSLKNLVPGMGYMYKSNKSQAVILVYPNGAGD